MGGLAAAMAAAVAVTPVVSGSENAPLTAPVTGYVEGSGFDHNLAHLGATPAVVRRAAARARLCDDDAWRARNPVSCPAPAPTRTQARTAAVAGADVTAADLGPLDSTQPDGLWGPLLNVPSTAIHAVVLPTNKVLWFSQPKYPAEVLTDGGNAHLFDPATGQSIEVPPPVVPYPADPVAGLPAYDAPANLWCGGQTLLADGRVLVVGGNLAYPVGGNGAGAGAATGFKGGAWVMTFDPWTETWTKYQDMDHGRWYPTLTEMPDGRVLIVGGWDETGGVETGGDPGAAPTMINNQDVEVFDPAAAPGTQATEVVSQLPPNGPGQPTPWPNHEGVGLYPHMFVLPSTTALGAGGDKILVAGPNAYDSAIIDTDDWVWTDVGEQPLGGDPRLSQDRSWATAWLEPSGPDGSTRVVLMGGTDAGGAAPGPGTAPPPSTSAEVLDLDDPDAGWQLGAAPPLNTGRAHFNTVLLPDGSIFTNGGGYGRKNDTLYAEPVYGAELLAADADAWTPVGNEADARTYHSTSVLLPDGRVLSAGDDRDIASATSPDHLAVANRTAQIWSPPYLFDGPRPVVTFAPTSVRYDAPFRVAVQGDPAAATRAVLVRPGAVTHSVDMSQQVIALDVTTQADGITATSPLDATVAPPGYYMLHVLNADGVPSVASWVRLDPAAPDAPPLPAVPVTPPPTSAPAPVAAPAPAPAPAPTSATPARPRLRMAVPTPTVVTVGRSLRMTVRLRATVRATATIRLTRPNGRLVTSRRVGLRAGRTVSPRITFRRVRLGGATRVRMRVTVRDTAGRTTALTRVARVPARR